MSKNEDTGWVHERRQRVGVGTKAKGGYRNEGTWWVGTEMKALGGWVQKRRHLVGGYRNEGTGLVLEQRHRVGTETKVLGGWV